MPDDDERMKYYRSSGWNLNNIATTDGSVLKVIETDINGVNVPWLYLGQLFATFCWHNEDNYLYSVNYSHLGAPKQWYGIPGADAGAYERVLRDVVPERLREEPDLIYHITTMISPSLLKNNDVPVYQLVQRPGEFIVTFPQAYHGGFSHGVRMLAAGDSRARALAILCLRPLTLAPPFFFLPPHSTTAAKR